MKICKNCGESFPNRVYINDKEIYLHTRSYCLKCSPRGGFKGYDLRKQNTVKQRKGSKTCIACGKKFKWHKNNVCSTCRNWYTRSRNRDKAIQLLGGVCINCKTNDPDVLTFHHYNGEKNFDLSWGWNKSWEKLEKELKKCQLLCCNCHMKIHRNEHFEKRKAVLDYYQSRFRCIDGNQEN